jgi:RIO kinase 2
MYELGYIHGDLSEFNILIDEDGNFLIIDFPQAIKIKDDDTKLKLDKLPGEFKVNTEYYLKRDLENILRYFKKYGINENLDTVYKYVVGK